MTIAARIRGMLADVPPGIVPLGLALGAAGAGRIVATALIGRFYGAPKLAELTVVLSIGMVASLPAAAGLQPAATKFLSQARGAVQGGGIGQLVRRIGLYLAIAILATNLVLLAIWPTLATHLPLDGTPVWVVLVLNTGFSAYYSLRGVLVGLGRPWAFALFEGAVAAIALALCFLPSLIQWAGPAAPATGGYALGALACAWAWRATRSGAQSAFSHGELLRYGGISLAGTAASLVAAYAASLVAGYYLSIDEVAVFGALAGIVLVLQFVPQVLGIATLPGYAFRHGAGQTAEMGAMLARETRLAAILACLMAGASMLLLPLALPLFGLPGGDGESRLAFALLVATVVLSTLSRPAVSFLSGTAHVRIPNVAGIVGALPLVVLWPWLVPRYGITGVAGAALISTAITTAVIMAYAARLGSSPAFRIVISTLPALAAMLVPLTLEYIFQEPVPAAWASSALIGAGLCLLGPRWQPADDGSGPNVGGSM